MNRRTLDTDQVVSSAAALADTEGLDVVTLTRVAERLGVRQPALYRHVDSYDGLIRALGLRGREILAERLSEAAVGLAGDDAVRAMGRAWRAMVQDHPGLYAATDRFACAGDDELEAAVERVLKIQLFVTSLLMTFVMYPVTLYCLPAEMSILGVESTVTPLGVFLCIASGLWGGCAIGFITEYYTSHAYAPVREVAKSCETGAATNIIFGLALGYKSAVGPYIAIGLAIYIPWMLAGMYGVAIASLGMLGTLVIALTIDAYGPVADNAGGIAEMAGMEEHVRVRTDILDAAGNTTAAMGKGFAIGAAILTSLALFAAFLTRADLLLKEQNGPEFDLLGTINLLDPMVFTGLFIGAVLPAYFSAMTMKSVGSAAYEMIEEVRRQFKTIPGIMEGTGDPDYDLCVAISTKAALKEMIAPGVLIMGTPLVVGWLFGIQAVAGVLAGSLVAGGVIAISSSNSGGAWDNAKKYVEAGNLGGKGTEVHVAAVVGDTVGDPLKDTSGPSLNILIKLSAILSLVFVPFFVQYGGLLVG